MSRRRPPTDAPARAAAPPAEETAHALVSLPLDGRPTKQSYERAAKLLEAIREGNYPQTACALAGVDWQTFTGWCVQGEQEPESPCGRFLEAVRHAEAESEARAVTRIRKAADKDWKAESTWLGRRHRERWSEQTTSQPSQAVVVNIGIALPGTGETTSSLVKAVPSAPLTTIPKLPELIE